MARKGRGTKGSGRSPASDTQPPGGRSARLLLGMLVLVVVVAAGAFAYLRSPSRIRRQPGLSVLLISVDTLRADALGAYGRAGDATAHSDRLAREGVRFERAHAHNVVTLPSHANLLSGRYPLQHGVRDNSGFRFPRETATLATLLKARGYRTGAFVSAFPLDSRFGLDAGFDVYDDRLGGAETHSAFMMAERAGTRTVAAAAEWLRGQAGAPTLCFVHLYEPHFPYAPPPEQAGRFASDAYQGEVAAADAALAPLLEPLFAAGAAGRTLVVFTSDHGEGLGEHAEETHGIFAYEATLRVPLILYAPAVLPRGVVSEPVRHIDVLPTILDALALEAPPDLPGRSLLPLVAGSRGAPQASYFEALSPSLNQGWAPLRGVSRGALKYVELPLPELYDLELDPAEQRNLVAERPQDLEALKALLARLRADERGTERRQESADALERLRALGYVAGGPAPTRDSFDEADDPKRLIEVDAMTRETLRRFFAGDVEGALATCRESLRRRPDSPAVLLQLAYLERKRGNLAAAVAAARRALEVRPLDAETLALLGAYLTEAGSAAEAVKLLQPAVAALPPDLDLLTAYGMALATAGRREEALAAFDRARQADPSNAMVLVNAGTVHLRSGDRARARAAFEAARGMDPGLARAHNSLGVIAAQEGRVEEAITLWQAAVALDPEDYQTLYNLGGVLQARGRTAEARSYFEAYLRHAPVALEARDIARVRAWLAATAGARPAR